jgi:hypothetical protein
MEPPCGSFVVERNPGANNLAAESPGFRAERAMCV